MKKVPLGYAQLIDGYISTTVVSQCYILSVTVGVSNITDDIVVYNTRWYNSDCNMAYHCSLKCTLHTATNFLPHAAHGKEQQICTYSTDS